MERKKSGAVFRELWNKYKFVALVIALGILLLLWPSGKKSATSQPAVSVDESESGSLVSLSKTEERMETILSRIDGVGNLSLMLTLEDTGGEQYAQDTELSYSGATSAPDDYDRRASTVVVSGDDGDSPVVSKQYGPTYRGALVVCQGAGNAEVRLAVTQAVSALTGLSSDRITVVRCQS